jgi:DnaJ domain
MTKGSKPLPADRASELNQWLRRRLRTEAWQQFFEGLVFLAIGLGVVAIAFCALLIFTGTAFGQVGGWTIAVEFFSLAAVIFAGSYLTRARAEYSGGKKESRFLAADVGDILFGAPGQLRLSINCFEKCLRLRRCDFFRVGGILLWLFDRRHKATMREICAILAPDDVVRVLPQLRDIPGVIWLTYHHGVIMLSPELRREMATALKQATGPIPVREAPPVEEKPPENPPRFEEPAAAKDGSGSAEKIAWYVTLNLPPFAPLRTVKKRYRELVKIYHPDAIAGRRPGTRASSDEQIKRINEAYHNILENSKRTRV